MLATLACNFPTAATPIVETVEPTVVADAPTATPSTIPTAAPTATPTSTTTPQPTPTPFGCMEPPSDYTRVAVTDTFTLNQRTLWMLGRAQELYQGEADYDYVRAITQGSYNPGVGASFGTHDGGGAVDFSVRDPNDWFNILYDDLDAIILALRQAGFAAWVRESGELYSGSPIHIHAIAVGDDDLSRDAALQLTGPAGYFRGYNGLPEKPPIADKWGEPIICLWMLEAGYTDLRGETQPGDNR